MRAVATALQKHSPRVLDKTLRSNGVNLFVPVLAYASSHS